MITRFLRPAAGGELSEPVVEWLRGVLSNGGVIATPAESSYGLTALARSPVGVARIAELKQSRGGRGFIVAVADRAGLESLPLDLSPARIDRLLELWPAPLTLVLRLRGALAADASGSATLAVRIPADPVLRSLCRRLEEPLVTTSANLEGAAPAGNVEEVLAVWPDALEAVVDDGPRRGAPTTIIDLTEANPRILRAGAWEIPEIDLEEIFTAPAEKS